MRVFLVRHAQSAGNIMDLRERASVGDFNALLRISPDHPLTEEGVRQAQGLAARLASARVARLYSSPFQRALQTAQIYGAAVGLEPVVVDELREVVPDVLGDRRRAHSLRRHYLRSFARMAYARRGTSWRGEYRRAKAAWARITAEAAELQGDVVAVSHAWIILLTTVALRRDPRWRVVSRDVQNAGVTEIVSR